MTAYGRRERTARAYNLAKTQRDRLISAGVSLGALWAVMLVHQLIFAAGPALKTLGALALVSVALTITLTRAPSLSSTRVTAK